MINQPRRPLESSVKRDHSPIKEENQMLSNTSGIANEFESPIKSKLTLDHSKV